MNGFGWTAGPSLTRRRFLHLAGASAATLALTQAVPRGAGAATWRRHEDTDTVGLHQRYAGGDHPPGCDTGEAAGCRGPGRMSCYWGVLYVSSVTEHRLRTGPFTGRCSAAWPGTGTAARGRWASHLSASVGAPESRLLGKLSVYDLIARPAPWTGLVLHPVHLDNCHNYGLRLGERDQPSHVVWGRQVDGDEGWIMSATLPARPPLGRWYDYRVDVLPGSRLRCYWNGALVVEATDPEHTFSGGPVGMRLDYCDAILDETRVYQP